MNTSTHVFSPLIRWCEIDGIVFVLDLKTDVYSALNVSLSTDWLVAARTGNASQTVKDVLEERSWRAADAAATVNAGKTSPVVAARIPLVRAAICLTRARENLRACGLVQTVRWAELHQPVASHISLKRAESAFRIVEGIMPNRKGDQDCLPRSLALFAMLRGYDLAVCHKIGLYRFPFNAHAWVESEGIPVLEREVPRDDTDEVPHHAPRTVIMKSV